MYTQSKHQWCICIYLDVFGDVDLTWPQVAEAGLFDKLTLVISIRDPQGHSTTTGL